MRWFVLALTFLACVGTASAQPYDVVVAGQEYGCFGDSLKNRIAEWISVPRAWRTVEAAIAVVAPASRGRVFAVTEVTGSVEIVELRYDAARVHIANVPAGWGPEALNVDEAGNMYLLAWKDGELSLLVYTAKGTLLFVYPMGTDFKLIFERTAVDLAADQCTLFLAAKTGLIRRFNVCTGLFDTDFGTARWDDISDLRVLPDGGLLIAAGELLRYSASGELVGVYEPSSNPEAIALTHGGTRVMIVVSNACEPSVIEIDLTTWEEKLIANIQQDVPMSIVPYFGWSAALGEAHVVRRRSARH